MVQTFLISPNKALLDEIYASPAFDPAPEPVLIGIPIELADGRLCVAHPWDEVVTDWLTGYTAGIAGAEVIEAETLPYAVKVTEEAQQSDSERTIIKLLKGGYFL